MATLSAARRRWPAHEDSRWQRPHRSPLPSPRHADRSSISADPASTRAAPTGTPAPPPRRMTNQRGRARSCTQVRTLHAGRDIARRSGHCTLAEDIARRSGHCMQVGTLHAGQDTARWPRTLHAGRDIACRSGHCTQVETLHTGQDNARRSRHCTRVRILHAGQDIARRSGHCTQLVKTLYAGQDITDARKAIMLVNPHSRQKNTTFNTAPLPPLVTLKWGMVAEIGISGQSSIQLMVMQSVSK